MNEVFSSREYRPEKTLYECFHWFSDTKGVTQASNELAEFCDVNPSTAESWLEGVREPKGETRVKAIVKLIENGHHVGEYYRLPEAVRQLWWFLGHEFIDQEDMARALGFTNKNWKQSLWEKLRGDSQLTPDQEQRAKQLTSVNKIPQDFIRSEVGFNRYPPTKKTQQLELDLSYGDDDVETLAKAINFAFPIAERIESDEFSERDRERLRELVGDDTFFRFSNILNRLSGPRARNHYRNH